MRKKGQTKERMFTTVETARLDQIMNAPKGSQHNMKKRFMEKFGRTKEEVAKYIMQRAAQEKRFPIEETLGDPNQSRSGEKVSRKTNSSAEPDTFEIRFKLKEVRIQGDELIITAKRSH